LVINSQLKNALLADGCCIENSIIENSVIGIRSQISAGVRITNTILMGNDYYEGEYPTTAATPIGIGEGCQIDGAIIDKNARLGPGVVIRPFPRGTELEMDHWVVRDGIVVIPKDEVIPGGTILSPD
jgi:glucose-1-phosphate adenylyltransferase